MQLYFYNNRAFVFCLCIYQEVIDLYIKLSLTV